MRDVWRKIWNGPFYVGELEQPISMGAAFLKVFEVAWRIFIIAVIGAILLVGVITLLIVREDHKNEERRRLEAKVTLSGVLASTACPIPGSFLLFIKNGSDRPITSVSFSVIGYMPDGRSIQETADLYLYQETRVEPRQDVAVCRPRPAAYRSGADRFHVNKEHVTFD